MNTSSRNVGRRLGVILLTTFVVLPAEGAAAVADAPEESQRMLRAKDLISDDRWTAAIPVLRAAAEDPNEPSRDEALFWLAHSQNRVGDLGEAFESIRRLQREFSKSRWTVPAYSLLIELAQKLGRDDVLWRAAAPPQPPVSPAAVSPPPPPRTAVAPRPVPPAPSAPRTAPSVPAPPAAAPVPGAWLPEAYFPDLELRIQALGSLIGTDADKVIPMLRNIAFETDNLAAARRAVFLLAQSRNPKAHTTVVDVAKHGPEPVRLVAVRELARFGGEKASEELMQVYTTAAMPVKQQVVVALGERAEVDALVKIVQSETNRRIREDAIITLGRAGGTRQLRGMYAKANTQVRRAIVRGLFNARDEEGLVRMASQEKDPAVRAEILSRLRLLGSPRAMEYIEKSSK